MTLNYLIIVLITVLFTQSDLIGQNTLAVQLKINNTTECRVAVDEPIVAQIVLSNPEGEQEDINNWQTELEIEALSDSLESGVITQSQYQTLKDSLERTIVEPPSIDLGSESKPWYNEIAMEVRVSDQAVIWSRNVCETDISPTIMIQLDDRIFIDLFITQKVAPGKYRISAVVGEVRSNSVELLVGEQTLPRLSDMDSDRLYAIGNRIAKCGDVADAMTYARELRQRDPESIRAMILEADLLRYEQRRSDALQLYELALMRYFQKYPDLDEAPEYLLTMIDALKND